MLLKYTSPTPFVSGSDSGNLLGKAPLAPTGINKLFERMDTVRGSKRASYTKSDGALHPRKKNKVDETGDRGQTTSIEGKAKISI